MKSISNLSIRKKLMFSFGIVLAILVIQGVSFLGSLSNVNKRVGKIVHDVQPALIGFKELSEQLQSASSDLGFYLLSKDDRYRDSYATELNTLKANVRALRTLPVISDQEDYSQAVSEIENDINRFAAYYDRMIELGSDENKNILAMAYASENTNPIFRQATQLLSQMVLSEEEEEARPDRKIILAEINKLRYAWINMLNEMRLFLAFRAPAAKENITIYSNSIDDLVTKMDGYVDDLSFEQADSYEQFKSLRIEFSESLKKLIEIHEGDKWRTDVWLIKNEIGPLLQQTRQKVLEQMRDLEDQNETATVEVKDIYSEQRTAFIFMMPAILGAVSLLAWLLVRNITRPLEQAISVADRLAHGEMSQIEVTSTNETGRLLSSLKDMQEGLKSRLRLEDEVHEFTRIKHALNKATTNIMVTDVNCKIVYVNQTAKKMFQEAETAIRKHLPQFNANEVIGSHIDILFESTGQQISVLDHLQDAHTCQVELGGMDIVLTVNPVLSDSGKRIGKVVELIDRTDEVAVEKEIDAIVNAAMAGDLSQRIDMTSKTGFYQQIGNGINSFIEHVESLFTEIANTMDTMSKGNLTHSMPGRYDGMFSEVQHNVNNTLRDLEIVVRDIRESTDVISTSSDQIAVGNTSLSERTDEQAKNLEITATNLNTLTKTARQNADNAQHANRLASGTSDLAKEGGDVVRDAVEAMRAIDVSSNKISEIISVINDISFQTNLLALNAAVEAARAGEQGKGFAVVATEVRNLAQRSASAAREIKGLIKDSLDKVSIGSDLVNDSGKKLDDIVDSVNLVNNIITEIDTASQEQTAGIQQVNASINQIDGITQQNAALAQQTSAASAFMQERASKMKELLAFFTVGTDIESIDDTAGYIEKRNADRPWDRNSKQNTG
jgi:methyl-accepting chemotaxis protein